jgi:DUF4097 and DUF4098 domain-containing protein YvlB
MIMRVQKLTVAAAALLIALPALDPPRARAFAQDRGGAEETERISRKFKIGAAGRLALANVSGDIVVTAGSGDEVTLEAVKRTRGARSELASVVIEIDDRPGRVDIRTRHTARRDRSSVDYTVTVPREATVDLSSVSGDVRVTNLQGALRAQSISGTVALSGSTNVETARSISGDVELSGSIPEARITGSTVSGTVRARDLKARALKLSAISGNADFSNVEVERLEAKTVTGDVIFAGAVGRNGRYEFATHSGNARLTISGGPGFDLIANTYSGNIRSDVPVTVNDARLGRGQGRSMRAVVGDGGATVSVSTFSGDIVIRKQ